MYNDIRNRFRLKIKIRNYAKQHEKSRNDL